MASGFTSARDGPAVPRRPRRMRSRKVVASLSPGRAGGGQISRYPTSPMSARSVRTASTTSVWMRIDAVMALSAVTRGVRVSSDGFAAKASSAVLKAFSSATREPTIEKYCACDIQDGSGSIPCAAP